MALNGKPQAAAAPQGGGYPGMGQIGNATGVPRPMGIQEGQQADYRMGQGPQQITPPISAVDPAVPPQAVNAPAVPPGIGGVGVPRPYQPLNFGGMQRPDGMQRPQMPQGIDPNMIRQRLQGMVPPQGMPAQGMPQQIQNGLQNVLTPERRQMIARALMNRGGMTPQ